MYTGCRWRCGEWLGILPESLGLFDMLTVEEHLLLCGPIYGLSPAETRVRADQLLEALGLEHGRHTPAGPVLAWDA